MTRSTALCIAIAGLCACTQALIGSSGTPCAGDCILELTNGTTLELDVRVVQRATGTLVREHLGSGESREILLTSSEFPVVTVEGARSPSMTRPLNVRVRCEVPVRGGDVFRAACRLASVSALPGDSAAGQPGSKSVQ
jgi:hypothetical protein